MAEILKRAKALAVSPLKVSQPVGASLAFLGLRHAIPMMHGSQGCTAFGKVFFVRHFREPIPLQTTAMDQVSTVMGADENVVEGLKTICEKNSPEIIGLPTTGLSEAQGTDVRRLVKKFRESYPQFDHIAVVPVNTPDFAGSLESGFAAAVEAIIEYMVPERDEKSAVVGRRRRQVNVLANSSLSPGDIEALKDWIEAFGLRPVVLPDIGDSLDGHLMDGKFSALTVGGTPKAEIETMGESIATLVIGRSLGRAADALKRRTAVPDFRFDHLMGLDACDAFTQTLAQLSGQPVPEKIERHRAQLQDAMVDTHFQTGFARVALALDADHLIGFARFLTGMGAEIVAAVSPARAEVLADMPCSTVQIGDLEDLENAAEGAQVVISNSHAAGTAERLGVPLMRAGFPQYDWVGGYARQWIGYRGARQALFDFANLILGQHHEIPAYRSIFRPVEEAGPGVVKH
ncbi:MAG: nitrogenase iron-molybdenum cofactor biosynthesis protein NifN [Rhodocyclales bacterium]|nr:nitrogenase iron-molybdenum cofactor biosynthesis protein NifN [Rhodocyclales bacterium]